MQLYFHNKINHFILGSKRDANSLKYEQEETPSERSHVLRREMKEIENFENTTVPRASKSMDYEGCVPIMSVTFGIAPEN